MISPDDVRGFCRDIYGIEGTATQLPGEFDGNYLITTGDGDRFVLKVMREDCDPGLIDLEIQALAVLASKLPGGSVPVVLPTLSGDTLTPVQVGNSERFVWMLEYLPGKMLGDLSYHPPELLAALGTRLADLDRALEGFTHPALNREHRWNLLNTDWVEEDLHHINRVARRRSAARVLERFRREVIPLSGSLRKTAIHGDANDWNVIVSGVQAGGWEQVALVDFGDMVWSYVAAEPAIAAAYAMFNKTDPLAAARQVISGYHARNPLTELEISVLPCMIAMRLVVSVTNAARRKRETDDPYVTVSEAAAWKALEYLEMLHPRLVHYSFRTAVGWDADPRSTHVVEWLKRKGAEGGIRPVLDVDLRGSNCIVLDLGVGSLLLGADPASLTTSRSTELVFGEMKRLGAAVGVGRYLEARAWYDTPAFGSSGDPLEERRTVHLGIDLFLEPGAAVHAPLDGVVHTVANNAAPKDYGPLVILRHEMPEGDDFFTLYGHLEWDSVKELRTGDRVAAGQVIARTGAPPENGDWAPHLHIQIITDLLDLDGDFPGVAGAGELGLWRNLSPDPNLLLGIPVERFPATSKGVDRLLNDRRDHIGPNLSVFYDHPIKIVRGWMQHLYDDEGRCYLDLYNNVAHVGHSHPHVVESIARQAALLNTNSRYLHDYLTEYAERLLAYLPPELSVCYFVNSGSEANELAVRLARTFTGRHDVIVLDAAYHGHTNTLIDMSPYKFQGPGGDGRKPWVHVAPLPDVYRGRYRRDDPDAARKYAGELAELIKRMRSEQRDPALFIAESLPSVGGQIVLPSGYLEAAYGYVRAAGGVCIADEVHVGFGRLGTHFWGFESQGVVPDIVVLGKPIGNGHPLGAVITIPAIARAFDNGMEFFSTFGGNPVSCAAGMAVLDVVEREGLQERALTLGRRLVDGLLGLRDECKLIGDVRGAGLFAGVELVLNRATQEPATALARFVANRLRDRGVLTGTDGPYNNVLKIRPPMQIDMSDIANALVLIKRTVDEAESWR